MVDLVIVGGGPAGATLARLVGRRYRTLLLEKRRFDGRTESGHKTCGGLLAPDAQAMLARFGLGVPKSVLAGPQLFSVRTLDLANSLERHYQRHYININRESFDEWLESLIPEEVQVVNGAIYQSFERKDDGIEIVYLQDGRTKRVQTRMLVGADGAFSKLRRQAFPNHPIPKTYVSIQEWFPCGDDFPYYGAIFDETITDFYSWTIPKEGFLILGTALEPTVDVRHRFDLLKEKLVPLGFPLTNPVKREGAYVLRPRSVRQICTGVQGIPLIGEAAGFISPSSAEGFSYGFRSALALAEAMETGLEGCHARYERTVKGLKRNVIGKNLKSIGMYNPTLRKIVMKMGLMSLAIRHPGDIPSVPQSPIPRSVKP